MLKSAPAMMLAEWNAYYTIKAQVTEERKAALEARADARKYNRG